MREVLKNKYLMHKKFHAIFILFILALLGPASWAEEVDLFELSFEELLNLRVSTASGVEESILEVPATILVISADQIHQRGYTDFEQILKDLPGFDVLENHGIVPNISFQRGHRSSWSDRTILMVDGVQVNSIWTQQATMAQQIPVNHIKTIEVLYGPAGAVYGANAFQGVIHIKTKSAADLENTDSQFSANVTHGSFNTTQADVSSIGYLGEAKYSVSFKNYQSDGVDLDSVPQWGFLDETRLNSDSIWGPVLDRTHNGVSYGEFYSPIQSQSVFASIKFNHLTFGIIQWRYVNGYGFSYPFDIAQPNVDWGFDVSHKYILHDKIINDIRVKTLMQSIEEQEGGGFVYSGEQFLNTDGALTFDRIDANTGIANTPTGISKLYIQDWKAASHAWKFRQDYESNVTENLRLQGGIKYQNNTLANQWDVCGGAQVSCSSGAPSSEITWDPANPAGIDFSVIGQTSSSFSSHKQFKTTDKGAYVLVNYDVSPFIFSAALRYDKNSFYGSFVKKRLSSVYRIRDRSTVKYVYGEAFQEPSSLNVWAELRGGTGNAKVEEVANHEIIFMHYLAGLTQEVSLYRASIDNVILINSSGSEDATRTINGLEYRLKYSMENVISSAADINGFLYYTYTDSQTDHTYDLTQSLWVKTSSDTGDIAPHKLHLGLNVPLIKGWRFNFGAKYYSERELYGTNTLNAQDVKVDSQTLVDMALGFNLKPFTLDIKMHNVFDEAYFLPGNLAANAGNDFFNNDDSIKRATAFNNSLVPQTGRTTLLTLGVVF